MHLLDDDGTLDGASSSLVLEPTAPFRLDLTVWALRRRAENVVDRWDPVTGTYLRTFHTDAGPVDVEVTQVAPAARPSLHVRLRGAGAPLLRTRHEVASTLERSLGLAVDLAPFHALAAGDPVLGPLVERFRGVRPPRFHTWTESLTAAVSCQQLSLAVGITLLNRLAERYGERGPSGSVAFPTAAALAAASPADLRAMGYSNRKAEAIVDLARTICDGELPTDRLEHEGDDVVRARLCELHGIGRWSAEYVMLRGLGRVAVFPGDDVGAQNKLRRWFGLGDRPDHDRVRELLRRWDPYAGLVYFHLLLAGIEEAGLLDADVASAGGE